MLLIADKDEESSSLDRDIRRGRAGDDSFILVGIFDRESSVEADTESVVGG